MAGVGDSGGLAGGPTLGVLCAIEPLFDTLWFTGIFFLFILAVQLGLQDLISWSRDRTHALGSKCAES